MLNKLFLFGNGSIFLGLVWSLAFPINKSLWTSSYVLISTGIALVFLAFLIYVIEVRKTETWAKPFIVMGLNPLSLYVLSILIVKIYFLIKIDAGVNAYNWLYLKIFVPLAGNLNGSLLFAITHVIIIWFAGWLLSRKNIVIKV